MKIKVSSVSPCVFIVKAIKILSSRIIAPVRHFSETLGNHLSSKFTMHAASKKKLRKSATSLLPVCSGMVHYTAGLKKKVNAVGVYNDI